MQARRIGRLWWFGRPMTGSGYDDPCNSSDSFNGVRNKKNREKWVYIAHHMKRDFRNFWESTNKRHNRPGSPVSVEGINDPMCTTNTFKNNFTVKSPLTPPSRWVGVDCIGWHDREFDTRFTAEDVYKAIKYMSKGNLLDMTV